MYVYIILQCKWHRIIIDVKTENPKVISVVTKIDKTDLQ
jgi:hypothetical protein